VDITPIIPADRQVIDGYGPGRFHVSGKTHEGALLVFPDHVEPWAVDDFASLTAESFSSVVTAEPKVEILLLGGGAKAQLLPSALRKHLREHGVVVDVMDSGAACRTYNVLLSEERRVAAALLPV
jgi:uncharacterized protein